MTTKKFIRVNSLKRNGTHAIVNWLASLYNPHTTKFVNDITCSYRADDLLYNFDESAIPALNPYDLITPEVVIFNHEDMYPARVNILPDMETFHDYELYDVIVLRDFFNQMASRFIIKTEKIRHIFPVHEPEYIQHSIRIWKMYAYEFLGMSRSINLFGHRIPINYNRWCVDREYRMGITSFFSDAVYNDNSIYQVSSYGWGSSFDDNKELEKKIRNDSERYRFLTRYKKCIHIPEYRELFYDKELVWLCNMIFGITYEGLDVHIL